MPTGFYSLRSARAISHCSGAAFYPTHQTHVPHDTVHTVNPVGHRETNTITRAELCGIAAAFDHEASLTRIPQLTIFTDSLASLFLLQSALHSPDSLTEKKHAPLQLYIRELLLARAALGFHTHMQKVPSHCGVIGNDLADIGAALALRNPAACQHSMSHVHTQHFANLPAWPTIPSPKCAATPTSPAAAVSPQFASDLTSSLLKHIDTTHSNITSGPVQPSSLIFPRQLALQNLSLPVYNNYMWHTSSCMWSQIISVMKLRSHTLYTASSHTSYPYTTALGPSSADTCPICPFYSSSPPPRDTPGHWLGSCSHPVLKSAYIARHNKALCLIQKTISTTAPAAWYTILDASAADRLPPGVSGNRLPSWLLPSLPSSTLSLLRPDMLVIQGLSLSSSRLITAQLTAHDPTTLALLKASCLLYIVELSFTCDEFYNTALKKKCHNTTTSSALSLQKVGKLPLPLSRLPYRYTCSGILPPPSLSLPRTCHHPDLLLVPSPHLPLP